VNILITGCCGVVSRAIARSIKLSDHYSTARIIGADVCDNWFGLHEALFDKLYRVSSIENGSEYVAQISNISNLEAIDLAIITPEKEVIFWTQNDLGIPATLPPPVFSDIASNKRKLYELLSPTGLVPDFAIHHRSELLGTDAERILGGGFPRWIRDFSTGSDSGKGALKVNEIDEIRAWVVLNRNIDEFMVSAFLPGRNYALCMLFDDGKLLKSCSYERLEYFMAEVAPSGITGNIRRGKLVNEKQVLLNAEAAVREIARQSGEKITGLISVDLREDEKGNPLLTEINIRHTAATSAYAAGGCNMVEAQIHHTLLKPELIDSSPKVFPKDNYILRDIDGLPILVHEINEPESGGQFLPEETLPC
jgi:carbamoyl-phosphate synthase large subunit